MLQEIGLTIAHIISLIAIAIICFGMLKVVILYLRSEYSIMTHHTKFQSFHEIRHDLAAYLLLALEMAVAVDIIESIVAPTYDNLIKLGALVLLRFLIGYLLNREMKELDVHKFNSKNKMKSGK